MKNKVIVRYIEEAIENGSIVDVGLCFDQDLSTIQFCVGTVVCRVQTNCKAMSVSYACYTEWFTKCDKLCKLLMEYIAKKCVLSNCDHKGLTLVNCTRIGILEPVHIPPLLWQYCCWSAEKDFEWHAKSSGPSLKQSLKKLFDPLIYNTDKCVDDLGNLYETMKKGLLQFNPLNESYTSAFDLMHEVMTSSRLLNRL